MSDRPDYLRVLATFARNSLVRDMTFRMNFLVECVTSLAWMLMNLGFYTLVFQYTSAIGSGPDGWDKHQFFVFMATSILVNSAVQAFFMPNCEEMSELVRTGGMDFALLKPIDAQFLLSLRRIEWSPLSNAGVAIGLLAYALIHLGQWPTWGNLVLYPLYVLCGVAILYSLMIVLAAVSVWLGRNQSLYDFWFYITNFSRYPLEIYSGPVGTPLQYVFTYLIPILVVVNVPARLLAKPLDASQWPLAAFALAVTALALVGSRWTFQRAIESYRSASS